MNVLVDTDVWSEFLRRGEGPPSRHVLVLRDLIAAHRVQLVGPIRQEILGGWRHLHQFEAIRELLRAFPDRFIETQVYEVAAEYFNVCRARGVQGSNTDFLLCACSAVWNVPILSKDQDYVHYRRHVAFTLMSFDSV